MVAQRVMTGARAKFGFLDPATGMAQYVGIFNNVSFSLTYDAQPVYVLGRYSAAEIEYTAQEPIRVTATGWRVIDHGAHTDGKLPSLQQLLNHEYLTLVITDRQTGKNIAVVRDVRPVSYDTSIANRGLEEITITFVGLTVDDESTANAESPGAMALP